MCFSVCHLCVRTIESQLKRSQSKYDGDFGFRAKLQKTAPSHGRRRKQISRCQSVHGHGPLNRERAISKNQKNRKQKLQHLNNRNYWIKCIYKFPSNVCKIVSAFCQICWPFLVFVFVPGILNNVFAVGKRLCIIFKAYYAHSLR